MVVLGIETSCDETSASVVKDGCELLSVVTASSMDLHVAYGGVVPEIAARSHIESIIPVIDQALKEAFGLSSTKIEALNVERKMKNGPTSNTTTSPFSLLPSPSLDPWSKIDAIAVTYGAGLGGSLLVGVMTARTLAIVKNKPLYAVNHVHGHVAVNFLTKSSICDYPLAISDKLAIDDEPLSSKNKPLKDALTPTTYHLPPTPPKFPMLALIVSGGHTQLVFFKNIFDYTVLGKTRDDAIGEAFDKVAKIVGLPYPGGPSVSKIAENGDAFKYKFPKAKLEGMNETLETLRKEVEGRKSKVGETPNTKYQPPTPTKNYDFSYSGLKTAVLRLAQQEIGEDFTFPSKNVSERLSEAHKTDFAASFQHIAVETVVDKTIAAYEEFSPKSVVVAGGVAANQELRRQLKEALSKVEGRRSKVEETPNTKYQPPTPAFDIENVLHFTDQKLCTDNGAMIATLGYFMAINNQPTADPYSLDIQPSLKM